MREFFHGWRRKAGAVTLVMACVLTGLWIRSRSIKDEHRFWKQGETSFITASERACLVFVRLWNASPSVIVGPYVEMDQERTVSGGRIIHAADLELESRWQGGGIEFIKRNQQPPLSLKNVRMDLVIVPYWAVVWPLTLLSAYLILWNPRKRGLFPNSLVSTPDPQRE